MIPMTPMPHELPKPKARPRKRKVPDNRVPAEERRRRLAIAEAALARCDSMRALSRALSRALGLPSGATTQWFTGARPVPKKHLAKLQQLADTGRA